MFSKYILASILALYSYDFGSDISVKEGYGSRYAVSVRKAENTLDKIAKESKIEDAWIHYNDTLIDVGYNEDFESVDIFISDEYKIQPGKTIILYHNHPSKDKIYPPSPTDILLKHAVNRYYHSNKVVAKILDGKRIWKYDIDSKLSNELIKRDYIEQKEYLKTQTNLIYNKYINNTSNDSSYVFKNIEEHIRIMKEVGVSIIVKKF